MPLSRRRERETRADDPTNTQLHRSTTGWPATPRRLLGTLVLAALPWATPAGAVVGACTNGINATSTCSLPASTQVTIEVWGGGGGGSRTNGNGSNQAFSGGGGGGGGYCRYVLTTTAGTDTLTIAVGAGGLAGTQGNNLDHGGPGGTSSALYTPSAGSTVTVTAAGGGGAQLGDASPGAAGTGAGGSAGAGCPALAGATTFSGGTGGSGVSMAAMESAGGGGGGSSAGTASAGGNGGGGSVWNGGNSFGAGGSAPSGGGAGGAGGGEDASMLSSFSSSGSAPGGGGGGGGISSMAMGAVDPSDGGAGQVKVTWTGGDVTPPTLTGVGVSGTTTTTTTLAGTSNEAATGYWVLQGWLAATPSAAQVKNGLMGSGSPAPQSGSGAMSANVSKTFSVSGMSAATNYRLCLMAEDVALNPSAVTCVDVTTDNPPDNTPPTLSGPTVGNVTGSSATISGSSNENGSLYWVVQLQSETAPSYAAAVVNHLNAMKWGSNNSVTAAQSVSFAVSGLAADTGYRACMVAEDAAMNASTVNCTTFRTASLAVNGQCGRAHGTGPLLTLPAPADMCSVGSPVDGLLGDDVAKIRWSCSGQFGGVRADCSATRGYKVTPSVSKEGVGLGNEQVVEYQKTTTLTVTLTSGYELTADGVTGCGGQLDAKTSVFTTGAITANCTVSASAAPQSTTVPVMGASVSGGIKSQTIVGSVTVDAGSKGKVGTLYVAAVLPASQGGSVFLKNTSGTWVAYDPANPAFYASPVTLGSHTLDVVSAHDLSTLIGTQIYAGYGVGTTSFGVAAPWNAMLSNGTYQLIHTVKEGTPASGSGRSRAHTLAAAERPRYAVDPRSSVVTARGPVVVTITALDAYGHPDPTVNETLNVDTLLAPTGQGLPQYGRVSPSRVALVNGTATVTLTPTSTGQQRFQVWSADGSRKGASFEVTVVPPSTQVFVDIASPATRDAVMELFYAGVVSGGGRYHPSGVLTRDQMALFVARAHDTLKVPPVPAKARFGDLPDGGAVQLAARKVAALGVDAGCAANAWCPAAPVSREQLALVLSRLYRVVSGADAPAPASAFADLQAVPAASQTAIARVAGLGVMSGTTPVTFDPAGAVSREQMALSLSRLLRLFP